MASSSKNPGDASHDDRLMFYYTLGNKAFDDEIGPKDHFQIVFYRGEAGKVQKTSNAKAKGKGKAIATDDKETDEQLLERFGQFRGSFGVSIKTSDFNVKISKQAILPLDLQDAIKNNEKLLVLVGYYIINADVNDGPKGSITNTRHRPQKPGDFDVNNIYHVGYKMGVSGKGKDAFALVNPDETGLCEIAKVPQGSANVFFASNFIDVDTGNKKHRKQNLGHSISSFTDPQKMFSQARDTFKQATRPFGQPAQNRLYEPMRAEDMALKAHLLNLKARLGNLDPQKDHHAISFLIKHLEQVGINDPGTQKNEHLVRLICIDEDFERIHAQGAIQEAKDLWPNLFEIQSAKPLDTELMFRIGSALRHGTMKHTVIVEYTFLNTFLGLVVLMDPKGEERDVPDIGESWLKYVRHVYESTLKLQWQAPANSSKDNKEIQRDATLESIKLALQSLSSMTRRAGESISQHAVRAFKLKTIPPRMATEDALFGLTNSNDYGAVRFCALAIWRNIADEFGEVYSGPILTGITEVEERLEAYIQRQADAEGTMEAEA
ncbi:hypothetical protein CDEST_08727 [Colletotrichum destructivum]|uniref:Uncharacterized protein n=1 Tax=Colletotrichum destructivum TaxID=34406 RepID=A0AAX4IL26_9PEZI|nr:hypothetical protein CDEST_08727 [Colletotrichum destructivum]